MNVGSFLRALKPLRERRLVGLMAREGLRITTE